jgi:hypothetical protein
MNTISKSLIFVLIVSFFIGFTSPALAYSPTMSVYSSGNSTTVSISGGQPNASVVINYTPSGSSLLTNITGMTDYSGNFTTMVSSANSSQINATVGGQQVYANNNGYNNGYNNGCTYNCGRSYGLSLSQSSLSLNAGQTASVTATYSAYGYSNSIYISSNFNSGVASASVSGNQINVYGSTSGSTTISVCSNSSGSSCATLYVTVSGGSCGYYGCGSGSLSLSQTSVSLNVGQSSVVTAYNNNSGSLYISSNSNSGVASASVSGNSISLYGSAAGSATISICSSNVSSCASLYVTVGGSSNYGSGSIYFSPSSLTLASGQSSTVSVYNNGNSYGSYYISSNSNSGVASASVSGSSLYVNALSAGSTSIIVCQSNYTSSCATLYATVTGVLGANTNLWFSPASPTMYIGQSLAVSINSSAYNTSNYYNNTAYYISSNSNSNVVTANISGTVLNLYANQNGSGNISVCSSALGFCGTLYVTVGGGSSNNYGGSLSLSQTSLSLSQGQSMIVSAYNVPSVYVSSNSNSGVVSVSASVNQVTFYGQSSGSSTIVLCGSSSGQCASVYVSVNGYGYNNGNIVLSQSTLGLNVGQSATVNVSGNGGYGYYISSNSNPGVVSASFNGSVITIYAISNGSSTLQICQNSASSCQSLYVTVGGYSYNSGYPYNNNGGGSLQYPGGSSSVLGVSTYLNGQLISEGSTVYIVYKNTQTAFSSASAFLGLGFKFSNVISVGNSGLASSGYTVTTSYAQHPWGSWIKSGSTVYFVHQSGLIPVPDWNTFLNNGGQAGFIVSANSYDFRLPMLSPMTSGDSRLQ